ncbi:otogelin [Lithobates pipiens]
MDIPVLVLLLILVIPGNRVRTDFLSQDPRPSSSVPAHRNNSRAVLQKVDPTSQGAQESEVYRVAAERKAQRVKCELLPCFNGGECIQKKFCDCGRYNASGSRCQIVYNTGADRENICRTWGQYHYETFDGVYYYYPGTSTYDLLRHSDPDEPSFAIQVHNDGDCGPLPYSCLRSLSLYFAGIGEITLQNRIVLHNNVRVGLPYTVGNVKIQAVSGYVVVRQQYIFSMAWDGNSSVYLKMSPDYIGRTHGLCGNNNWIPQDDLVTSYGKLTENIEEFVNSWREDLPHKSSPAAPLLYEPPCAKTSPRVTQMSHSLCSALLQDPFHQCHHVVSPSPFMASCATDLCRSDGDVGTWCHALAEYARSCAHAGHPLHGWRETYRQCVIPCESDLVYNECIACCPNSCHQRKPCIDSEIACVDGCYCTEGLIFENRTCVHPSECPCDFHGTVYPAGSIVQDRCNNCTCSGGRWICTDVTCPAECSVTGDFHIVTFDGRKFTFQAPCQYILTKSRTSGAFTVSVQNAPCGQNLDGSCIQSVNLIMDQDQRKQVTLTQAGDVLVYDQYKINLPYTDDVFRVRKLSSVFVQVKTDIGLQLLYDRRGLRLYLQLDGHWKDNTAGLCGTFNDNTQDDFLSPVGVPESTPQLFGYSWKTSSACRVEYPPSPLDPCDVHLQAASYASESCSIISHDVFARCHPYLSPVSYYEQCRRDTCKCGEECLCSALAHYAYQCRSYGIVIDFRSNFPDCGLVCGRSMVYGTCVDLCAQTCQSLSSPGSCDDGCSEGCACPEGTFLHTELETCVERSRCPCYIGGMDYQPGEDIITSLGRCRCEDGVMSCESQDSGVECAAGLIYYNCSQRAPDPELSRERTCENHLLNVTTSTHLPCVSGCVCPRGLVKHGNECFPPDACPCSWKAKEYFPGEVVSSSCHTCVCHHGSFQCSFRPCPAMCTFYGDRHFRTFDGLAFDFLGTCKVHLVKSLTPTSFSVIVENVNCYSAGTICRKSITINVGESQILFDDESGNPSTASIMDERQELHIWQAGFFTFVHFPWEDITILWDQRTTVHVQAGPRWQGLLAGLCGNFDLKTVNEMRSPDSYELSNPQEFGNSWAATECADSPDTRNPCTLNPLREPFAKKECAILLSEVFEACHPVVDVTWFYSNCLSDTCGCNRGGDCECFCTSVSAYAHQCCQQGVSVDWRSPRLCPYDCEFYNKVVGKGPYRLRSFSHSSLVLAVRFSDAIVAPVREDGAIPGHTTSFMLIPGLYRSHDRNLVSLELADRPNYFLYAANNGTLLVTKWRRSQVFQSRATFLIRQNAWMAGYNAFESFTNPGHFLRLSPTSISLSRYRHSAAYRRSTLFKLSEAPVPLRSACQWRYDACSSACFRTCRDPAGEHCANVPRVEGCIPQCPPDLVLDEVTRKCVYFQDCIEPAVITTISITEPQKPASGLNVTESPTSFSLPPSITQPQITSHKVPPEGTPTSHLPGVVPSAASSTLFPGSPAVTRPEPSVPGTVRASTVQTTEVEESTRTVSRATTSSPFILETTLNKTEFRAVTSPASSFLSPEMVLSTAKVTKTMHVTSELTSQVPSTQTVPAVSPGVTAGRVFPAVTSPVLTDRTALSALPNVTSTVLPALLSTVLTSKSVTTTLSTQMGTTVPTERTPRTGTVPHKSLHTSVSSSPVTGPSMTSPKPSYSQMVPSSLSPLHTFASSPYSLVSSSGAAPTSEPWQAKAQTFLIATKLVTPTEGFLPSMTNTSITKSTTTKLSSRLVTLPEAARITTESSPIEPTPMYVTSPLETSKYSPVSTDLTAVSRTAVSVVRTSLPGVLLYTGQTPAEISQHFLMSSEPSPSPVSETSRTSIPTSTRSPIITSQSSRTTRTETPGIVKTSSGTTGPTTTRVSLSKPSADLIHLATKPKPRVTEEEHILEILKFTESVLKPIKTTLRSEVASTSSASTKVHAVTAPLEATTTHLLPSSEKSTTSIITQPAKSSLLLTTSIQEPSNITVFSKVTPSTGRTLLPTHISVHDRVPVSVQERVPVSVHTYPPEGLSQSTSHTGPTQETLMKTSSTTSTKNVTSPHVVPSKPLSSSDETSISMSGPTFTSHVTDTSRMTESPSHQTSPAISPSLSPAVSYSTTQLAEPRTTKGKALLTDAINTTYIPSSLSPLSTKSTPVGGSTELPLQFMTATASFDVTESVRPTETLFVSGENGTEWRALSTAETYKTSRQFMSASQPEVVSETLASDQPTIKESQSPGPPSKEMQTSSVIITRDTVTGTRPPHMTYPSPVSSSSAPLTSQYSLQSGVPSHRPLQTDMTSLPPLPTDQSSLHPIQTNATSQYPLQTSVTSQYPLHTSVTSQYPLHTSVTSQHPLQTRVTSQHPLQTSVTSQHPLQTSVTSQYPLQTSVTSQHPLHTSVTSQYPLHTSVTSQHPLQTRATSQHPLQTSVTSQYPIQTSVTSQYPIQTSATSQHPLQTSVTSQYPIQTSVTSQYPIQTSVTSQYPIQTSAISQHPLQTSVTSHHFLQTSVTSQHPLQTSATSQHPIQTSVTSKHPLQTSVTSQHPLQTSVTSQHPLQTSATSQHFLQTSATSQHPLQTSATSQHPLQTSATSQHPLQTSATSQHPLQTSATSQHPLQTSETSQHPLQTSATSQHPLQTSATSQHPLQPNATSQHPLQTSETSQHPLQTSETSQHPLQTSGPSQRPLQTRLTSQHPLEIGVTSQLPPQTSVTPEITDLPIMSNKTIAAETIVPPEFSSVLPETSQVVTSPPRTSPTEVSPPPVTRSLNITVNQTGIPPRLTSTTRPMSTQIPLVSSSGATREMESSFPAELMGLTVSAMLPSRESATFLACAPYTENECIKHICVDGQLIQVNKSQHCPYNVTQPSCGLLGFAVQINGDRCCPKWECACRCSVFSDLSFVTFDGRYLALYKEASYIVLLTEEESITVQVSRCGARPQEEVRNVTLCSSMLELTYLSNQIIIDRLSRKVSVNSRSAWPMVRKYGYRIVDTGNMYFIETPSSVRIQWFHSSGLMIIESNSTTKPPSMGLCGLCDGNTTNDLILPNGRLLTPSDDSDEFLDSWQVPYTLKYVGKERRQDGNCSSVDCSPCFQMIVNQTFSSCHPYVSPEEFCELWAQDAEYIRDPCKALTAYAAMCHKFNVCIQWRNPNFCPFQCPPSLVYRACLAVCDVPRTCQNNEIDLDDSEACSALTEACVCPEGAVLHHLHSALCVPHRKCACTDSSGVPREIGETWKTSVDGCCMYQCAANESIIPVPYNCSVIQEGACRRYGEMIVTVSDTQSCCPHQMCVCNQSLCSRLLPSCLPHQKLTAYHREDSCCPRYTCECDPDKCRPVEEPPPCREDQTLFLAPVEDGCCVRRLCGCNVCTQRVPTCREGQILTITNNATHSCCPTYQCVCDTARCSDVSCDMGMSVLELWTPGSCCPYRTCECSCEKIPKPECNLGEKLQIDEEFLNSVTNPCNCTIYKCVKASVCLSKDGGILRPGQTIIEHTAEGVCHTAHCTSIIDPVSRYHQINISSLRCAARCQPNQVYEPPRDVNRCCGHCHNVSCIQTLLNGTLLTHRPGSSWIAKCLRYDCTNTSVGPVLMTSAINCPPFNETECIKMGGYVVSFLEGCCKTCKEDGKFCKRVTVRMTIRKNDCRSNTPVNIVSCDGKCPSASIYNYNINTYARFCKCCRELGLQRRVVQLYCTGNSTWVNYSIQEPTDCSCQWS